MHPQRDARHERRRHVYGDEHRPSPLRHPRLGQSHPHQGIEHAAETYGLPRPGDQRGGYGKQVSRRQSSQGEVQLPQHADVGQQVEHVGVQQLPHEVRLPR